MDRDTRCTSWEFEADALDLTDGWGFWPYPVHDHLAVTVIAAPNLATHYWFIVWMESK
ncbi:MAG: hypothetical protein KUG66_01100 [Gammaproteobacteria bacterium]|nr:hypothetical protein [Gammaproteobacteria bacterium]